MGLGLLAHALASKPAPLKNIKVLSAGVSARLGKRVSENSVTALKKVGVDISQHRATPLTQKMLDEALAALVMTESHRALIKLKASPVPKNLHLFLEFLPKPGSSELPDPFGGPLRFYEQTRDQMIKAVPSIVDYLSKLLAEAK